MRTTTLFFLFFGFTIALTGCGRPDAPAGASQVSIVFPNKSQFANSLKVSALAAIDYNSLCFAVNVKSPKILKTQNSCDVERGISVGSVASGSEIVIADIPIGPDNTFEIYGLVKSNPAEPCPVVDTKNWNHSLNKIYLIGKKTGVILEKQDEEVTITLTMPEQSSHIAYENSFPATCTANGVAGTGSYLLGAEVLTGTSLKLKSTASFKEESTELSGITMKIRDWKTGVSQ